jgi:S1-C subfamily serine protease
VNLLDVVVVGTACAVTVSGWRFGFFARFLAWAGVAVGLMVGVAFVPGVVTNFGGTAPNGRATAGVVFLALVAVVGEGAGLALAIVLDRLRVARSPSSRGSRLAGAACGLVGVLVLTWLVVPSLSALEGWPSRLARGSVVASTVDDFAPRTGFSTALSSAIATAPYVTPHREREFDIEHAPTTVSLPFAVERRVRRSVVLVSVETCDDIQTGTGWFAHPGLVVTAGHVLSDARDVRVRGQGGTWRHADIVMVDRDYDVAVLRVDDLRTPALDIAQKTRNTTGAVVGYADGNELRVVPARIAREGYGAYTDSSIEARVGRHLAILDAPRVREGDSGAPLVNDHGKVAGVVFGKRGSVALAITVEQVVPMLRDAAHGPTTTGPCEP